MDGPTERMAALREALGALGLEPREDSRLCAAYVMFGRGDVHAIAATMKEMDFFLRNTGYARAIRVVRAQHRPHWLDRDLLSALAKRRALFWLVRAGNTEVLDLAPASLKEAIVEAQDIARNRVSLVGLEASDIEKLL